MSNRIPLHWLLLLRLHKTFSFSSTFEKKTPMTLLRIQFENISTRNKNPLHQSKFIASFSIVKEFQNYRMKIFSKGRGTGEGHVTLLLLYQAFFWTFQKKLKAKKKLKQIIQILNNLPTKTDFLLKKVLKLIYFAQKFAQTML